MSSAARASKPRDVPSRPQTRTRTGTRTHTHSSSSAAARTRPAALLLTGSPRWLPAAVLVAGPVIGAVLGHAAGGYHGPAFAVLTVGSAALATASATPNGRWWVIPALPPVAWLVAATAELGWHDPPYQSAKAKAVGLVHATTHVFPVIVAALVTMGLVSAAAAAVRRRPRGGRRA
ncbi:MAG: hypothetical protein HOW97_06055 [Catenulispora sp.]|nr:hypothetical protein [Catenulispora sp.]